MSLSIKKELFCCILICAFIGIGIGLGYKTAESVAESHKKYCRLNNVPKAVTFTEPTYEGKEDFEVTSKDKLLILEKVDYGNISVGVMTMDYKTKDESNRLRYQLKKGDKFKITPLTSASNGIMNYKVTLENTDGSVAYAVIEGRKIVPITEGKWFRIKTESGKSGWIKAAVVKELTSNDNKKSII